MLQPMGLELGDDWKVGFSRIYTCWMHWSFIKLSISWQHFWFQVEFAQIHNVLPILQNGRKGPCWGYLKRGDVITHVNNEAVDGKTKQKVVDLFNSSWKAVFDVIRDEGILATSSWFARYFTRANISRSRSFL